MDNSEGTYNTILSPSEGTYKEKGSKFIGMAYPVNNEVQIKQIIREIKADHHAACHHCYGFRLGADHAHFRFSDDGEPSSSAGKPIFGQIQSYDLTNTLIVVVRYYGGVKLGVGGLINAYREAAKQAIVNNTVVQKHVECSFELIFDYNEMDSVMRIVKEVKASEIKQKFDQQPIIEFRVRKTHRKKVIDKLDSLQINYKIDNEY